MEHESVDPGRATADVTTLRRWLREVEDAARVAQRERAIRAAPEEGER